MIKYIGSKRRLVPVLGELAARAGARRALDLFTGTTRVAQELKRRGAHVTAVDSARYAEILARCYIESDAESVDADELARAIDELNALPGNPGYVTETFCEKSRFFQPFNGERIDAVRQAIADRYCASPLEPLLLTSLLEAADRVDSTTGIQMAYVKQWAPRSFRPLELRAPLLLRGPGRAMRADAHEVAGSLGEYDLAYLDPPYNQHRYFTNYHVWETLVAWDAPEHYGVACKRIDSRDPITHSVFNRRATMPQALAEVLASVHAETVIVSYNDESWVRPDELTAMCEPRGYVAVLAFPSRRYVGAQIGIFNPAGEKVGRVSHLANTELVIVVGPRPTVRRMVEPFASQLVTEPGATARR